MRENGVDLLEAMDMLHVSEEVLLNLAVARACEG